MVTLRDGRKLFGILRSYDQFGNLTLEDTIERLYVDLEYAEDNLGVFLVRGENIVLVGEIVHLREGIQRDRLLTAAMAHILCP